MKLHRDKEIYRSRVRSLLRKKATRTLAYVYEQDGNKWTSVREVLPEFVESLEIEINGRRKSDLLIECYYRLSAKGISVPATYTPPWYRENYWRMRVRL